jgi:hypothetical protein
MALLRRRPGGQGTLYLKTVELGGVFRIQKLEAVTTGPHAGEVDAEYLYSVFHSGVDRSGGGKADTTYVGLYGSYVGL